MSHAKTDVIRMQGDILKYLLCMRANQATFFDRHLYYFIIPRLKSKEQIMAF